MTQTQLFSLSQPGELKTRVNNLANQAAMEATNESIVGSFEDSGTLNFDAI